VGVTASGSGSSAVLGHSTISGNTLGISATGGAVVRTFGDNRLEANPNFDGPNNGTPFSPALTPK
jgi:hypothetical protein